MDVAMEDEDDRATRSAISVVGAGDVIVECPASAAVCREFEARRRSGCGTFGHGVTVPAMG